MVWLTLVFIFLVSTAEVYFEGGGRGARSQIKLFRLTRGDVPLGSFLDLVASG